MEIETLKIKEIPSILWGKDSLKWIIAVHGNCSSKIDDCIYILAEEAVLCGYQVLSFDLPKHGERVNEPEPCMVQECVNELSIIMDYVKQRAEQVYLFGCSMGAYFSLLAYKNDNINYAWFLSPVTDMERLINNIMRQFEITEEQLCKKKKVDNPIEPLYWDYYCYVREHPIIEWKHPTSILRGEYDTLCEYEAVSTFAKENQCELEEQKGGEHWFHTPQQLEYFRKWIQNKLKKGI